jgi:hypothetical protein
MLYLQSFSSTHVFKIKWTCHIIFINTKSLVAFVIFNPRKLREPLGKNLIILVLLRCANILDHTQTNHLFVVRLLKNWQKLRCIQVGNSCWSIGFHILSIWTILHYYLVVCVGRRCFWNSTFVDAQNSRWSICVCLGTWTICIITMG